MFFVLPLLPLLWNGAVGGEGHGKQSERVGRIGKDGGIGRDGSSLLDAIDRDEGDWGLAWRLLQLREVMLVACYCVPWVFARISGWHESMRILQSFCIQGGCSILGATAAKLKRRKIRLRSGNSAAGSELNVKRQRGKSAAGSVPREKKKVESAAGPGPHKFSVRNATSDHWLVDLSAMDTKAAAKAEQALLGAVHKKSFEFLKSWCWPRGALPLCVGIQVCMAGCGYSVGVAESRMAGDATWCFRLFHSEAPGLGCPAGRRRG